mgnify:CR=1 FL=1
MNQQLDLDQLALTQTEQQLLENKLFSWRQQLERDVASTLVELRLEILEEFLESRKAVEALVETEKPGARDLCQRLVLRCGIGSDIPSRLLREGPDDFLESNTWAIYGEQSSETNAPPVFLGFVQGSYCDACLHAVEDGKFFYTTQGGHVVKVDLTNVLQLSKTLTSG